MHACNLCMHSSKLEYMHVFMQVSVHGCVHVCMHTTIHVLMCAPVHTHPIQPYTRTRERTWQRPAAARTTAQARASRVRSSARSARAVSPLPLPPRPPPWFAPRTLPRQAHEGLGDGHRHAAPTRIIGAAQAAGRTGAGTMTRAASAACRTRAPSRRLPWPVRPG